jgi:CRP-like cAMP-binding protein
MRANGAVGSYYDLLVSVLAEICGRKESILKSEVVRSFHPENYDQGSYYVREGDIPGKISFMAKGLMKYHYIDRDGNEWIKHFSAESDFVASYASFLRQSPSPYYIQAMEDAAVLSIPYAVYAGKIASSMMWCLIARKITERIYHEKERREAALLKEDGTARYLSFLKDYPRLRDRITLKDTASFLGLTPVSLSRIRKKISRRI